MKTIVLSLLVASCYAAPALYQTVPVSTALLYAQSDAPAVMKIPEPGINLGTPVRQVRVNVPVPTLNVAAPVPVIQAAPEVPVFRTAAVVAPAPVPDTRVVVAAPVKSVAVVAPAAPSVAVVEPPRPLDAPEPPLPSLAVPHVGGQFHSQDEAGQYAFGHYGGPNTRVETRDFLGRTSGSFAYVDPEGDVQVRKYAAAPMSGFRVAASDLVEDTPEVAQVKSALARAQQDVKSKVFTA